MINVHEDILKRLLEEVIDERINKFQLMITGARQSTDVNQEMTMQEVVNYFKVSRVTIHHWIKAGHLKSHKKGNNRYFERHYIELFKNLKDQSYFKRLPPLTDYRHPNNMMKHR